MKFFSVFALVFVSVTAVAAIEHECSVHGSQISALSFKVVEDSRPTQLQDKQGNFWEVSIHTTGGSFTDGIQKRLTVVKKVPYTEGVVFAFSEPSALIIGAASPEATITCSADPSRRISPRKP